MPPGVPSPSGRRFASPPGAPSGAARRRNKFLKCPETPKFCRSRQACGVSGALQERRAGHYRRDPEALQELQVGCLARDGRRLPRHARYRRTQHTCAHPVDASYGPGDPNRRARGAENSDLWQFCRISHPGGSPRAAHRSRGAARGHPAQSTCGGHRVVGRAPKFGAPAFRARPPSVCGTTRRNARRGAGGDRGCQPNTTWRKAQSIRPRPSDQADLKWPPSLRGVVNSSEKEGLGATTELRCEKSWRPPLEA